MEQWTRHNLWIWKDDKPVAKGIAEKITDLEQARIDIEFIVRACNAHEALIEACKIALRRIEREEVDNQPGSVSYKFWLEDKTIIEATLKLGD